MALTTGTGVPTVIECGNNYAFQETFTSFPVGTFTMQFIMQIKGSPPNVFNATTNGTAFQVNLSNITVPGLYQFSEYVTEVSSGQRATAKTGVLQAIPDLSQTQPLSAAATLLAELEAAITKLLSGGFVSVSVNNVSYTRYDLQNLIAYRTRLKAEVKREQDAEEAFRGVETSGRISTRFVPAPAGVPFLTKDIDAGQ